MRRNYHKLMRLYRLLLFASSTIIYPWMCFFVYFIIFLKRKWQTCHFQHLQMKKGILCQPFEIACVIMGRDNDTLWLHIFPLLMKVEARSWYNALLQATKKN